MFAINKGTVVCAMAPSLSCVQFSTAAGAKTNILIILTDDQGYHDVSYYGTKVIQVASAIDTMKSVIHHRVHIQGNN